MHNDKTLYYNYLEHHGILGQRWGKRNGPPYPLGASDHSAREKKAGWRKSLNKNRDKKCEKTKKFYNSSPYEKGKSFVEEVIDKNHKIDIKGFEDYVHSDDLANLTDRQLEDFCVEINPTKSKTNCGSCAAAIHENTNGGNYQALPKTPDHMKRVYEDGSKSDGYDPDKLIECFKGAKWSKRFTTQADNGTTLEERKRRVYNAFKEEVLSKGDNSKGIFYAEVLKGYGGGGHFFQYDVIDKEIHILEGQAHNRIHWKGEQVYENVFDRTVFDENHGIIQSDLTNCPLIEERRKDLMQERKERKEKSEQ